MMGTSNWISILAAIFLVRWIAFEALAERATRRGDEVLFRPSFGLRLLFGIALPGFIYAAGAVVLSEDSREAWWLSLIFVGFATLVVLVWPADIGVSTTGIYKRKWLGLYKKTIRWEDVDYATTDPSDNSVRVVAKSGFTIQHTRYHIDRQTFLATLKSRCRLV